MRQLAGRFRNGSWPIYCHNYFYAHSKHSWELWPNFRTSSWDIFMSHECTDLCAPVQKKMFKSMFTFVQRLTPCVSSEELNCPEQVSRNWYLAILFCKSISFIFSSCSGDLFWLRDCAQQFLSNKILCWTLIWTQNPLIKPQNPELWAELLVYWFVFCCVRGKNLMKGSLTLLRFIWIRVDIQLGSEIHFIVNWHSM